MGSIEFLDDGDMFTQGGVILVNTVNCVGVMGKARYQE